MPAETTAFVGKGGQLGYNIVMTTPATTTTTYTFAASVKTVSVKRSNGEVDNVVLDSTFTPYLALIGEGSADITFNYIPGDAGVVQFLNLLQTGASAHWAFKTAAGSLLQWDGFFTDFSVNFANKDVVDASATIRWTIDMVATPAT